MEIVDFRDKINDALGEAPIFTFGKQRDFRTFMDLTKNLSWDIPSALMAICAHEVIMGEEWSEFGEFPMHREPQPYWDGQNPWPIIDRHFEEVHHLDLTDPQINWSFDT